MATTTIRIFPTEFLFQAADQESVRRDLANYFGAKAPYYLDIYESMRIWPLRKRWIPLPSWNWRIFFGGFVTTFYRGELMVGLFLLALCACLLIYRPSLWFMLCVFLAMQDSSRVVHAALIRILKADKLDLTGDERAEFLRGGKGVPNPFLDRVAAIAYLALLTMSAYFHIAWLQTAL